MRICRIISDKFSKNKFLFLLLFVIFVGSVLRLYHLGKQSLWLDEAYSVLMSKNLATLWFEQAQDSSPPLYYSILYYWIRLFGDSEFSIRLLSAIFGISLIPLIFVVGNSIFNKEAGIYAALFAAISPIHIYYSQEARMYTLLALLSLSSFFLLDLSIKKKKNVFWFAYAFITILALYTHNYGFFLPIAGVCFYFFSFKKEQSPLPKFALSQLCIFIMYIPRLLIMARQIGTDMNPWIGMPTLEDFGLTFLHFSILSWRLPLTAYVYTILKIIVPVYLVILLVGIIASQKQKTFLVIYMVIPLILAFAISLKRPIYVAGRYDILVFPAFCLLIAAGLSKIAPRILRVSLLAIIVTATSIILYRYYFIYKKSDDREVVNCVQNYVRRNDFIVVTELSITPFEYYWRREFLPKTFQYPPGPRGYLVPEAIKADRAFLNAEVDKLTSKIYPLLENDDRLWLIYNPIAFWLACRLFEDLEVVGFLEFAEGDNWDQVFCVYIFKKP